MAPDSNRDNLNPSLTGKTLIRPSSRKVRSTYPGSMIRDAVLAAWIPARVRVVDLAGMTRWWVNQRLQRRHWIVFASTVFVFGATGCAGTRDLTLPDMESEAAQTYSARCGGCHAVPHPKRLSFDAWQRLLPLMDQRMAERGMEALDDEERARILSYLERHAR